MPTQPQGDRTPDPWQDDTVPGGTPDWRDRYGDGVEDDEPALDVVGPGGLRVLSEPCATCVFRPGNLMDLQPGRLQGMVQRSLATDTAIICHSTLDRDEQAVCRGFADAYDTAPLQVARRLGMLIEVDPPPSQSS